MEKYFRGELLPLVTSKHSETDLPFCPRLVVSVNLSDTGTRPILLQVDSGSDGPILYAATESWSSRFSSELSFKNQGMRTGRSLSYPYRT